MNDKSSVSTQIVVEYFEGQKRGWSKKSWLTCQVQEEEAAKDQ